MTFASIVVEKLGVTLRGYVMDDGTFQFIIRGKMHTFTSIPKMWEMWTDTK